MPTPIVLLANHLSQTISNFTLPFYFATWSSKKLKWAYKLNPKKSLIYYLIIWGNLTLLLLCGFIIAISVVYDLLPKKKLFLCALPMQSFVMSLICDLMLILYGHTFVTITNWLFETEWEMERNQGHINMLLNDIKLTSVWISFSEAAPKKPKSNNLTPRNRLAGGAVGGDGGINLIGKELRKIFTNDKPDWIGLLLIFVAVFYFFGAFHFAFLYSFGNQDHFYLIFSFVDILTKNHFRLTTRSSTTFLRYLLCILNYQAIMMSFRSFIMLTVNLAYSFINLLLHLRKARLSIATIDLYTKLVIAFKCISGLTNGIISGFFTVAYLTVVLGINAAVYAIKLRHPIIFAVVTCLSILMVFFTEFVFRLCCFTLEFTEEIIGRWRQEASRGGRGQFIKRSTRSIQPMMVRYWYWGMAVVRRGMKMDYFCSMLDRAVELILIGDELLSF